MENNTETHVWSQLDLTKSLTTAQSLGQETNNLSGGHLYAGTLQRSYKELDRFSFTAKFRTYGQPWQWVKNQSGIRDGEVIFQNKDIADRHPINYYLYGMDEPLQVEITDLSLTSCGTPTETHIWSITSPIPATDNKSTSTQTSLGLPAHLLLWFCLSRESHPWLCPRHDQIKFDPNEDVILVSILRADGSHLVLLAVSFNEVLTVISHDGNGNMVSIARNECKKIAESKIVVAVGRSFENASEAAINYAKWIVSQWSRGPKNEIELLSSVVQAHVLEAYLGQNLTDEKLYKALSTIDTAGIKFSTLIIDDNWQSIDKFGPENFQHRWLEFEADGSTFTNGLKHTIRTIRDTFPYIKQTVVWHGLMGYWNGITPDGPLAKYYKTRTFKGQDNGFFGGGSLTVVNESDIVRMYADFYQFLADWGIDSVKIDTQFLLNQLDGAEDRCSLTAAYQDAYVLSSVLNFSARVISCMSQILQTIFYSQFLSSLPRHIIRNSEDFFPNEPASHPWLIFCKAHNNVLTRYLNILPDWDMFQTSQEYSAFHAAERCISGGPIYFTDKPGYHDTDLIKQMTASNMSETIILRPRVARTNYVYASKDERRLLRIATSTVEADYPMLGILNLSQEASA